MISVVGSRESSFHLPFPLGMDNPHALILTLRNIDSFRRAVLHKLGVTHDSFSSDAEPHAQQLAEFNPYCKQAT
jgi:hypothetical protein